MSPLQQDLKLIDSNFDKLAAICKEQLSKFFLDHCKISIKVINASLIEVKRTQKYIEKLFTKQRLFKRHLLDVVGEVANMLFGVMDDRDAKAIDENFKNLERNQVNLKHSFNTQTTIISHLVNSFNKTTRKLNRNFETIHKEIVNLYDSVQNLTMFERGIHTFDDSAQIISISISHLLSKQNELLDIIQKARLNQFNRHILQSTPLLNSLKEIQLELIGKYNLPFKLSNFNLPLLNKIAKIEPIYVMNTLMIKLTVPLISDTYNLFQLTSLPALIKKITYFYVKTDQKYVAINEIQRKYVFLTESEFQTCIKIDKHSYISTKNFIIYNEISNNCIVRLISGQKSPQNCDIKIFSPNHEIWYSLLESNSWLFVIPATTNFKVICPNESFTTELSGSGIVRLNEDCKAITAQINLQTEHHNIESKPITYFFNSSIVVPFKIEFPLEKENMTIKHMENFDFDELGLNIKNSHAIIYNEKQLIQTHKTLNIMTITFAIITIVLIISIIFWIVSRFFNLNCRFNYFPNTNPTDTTVQPQPAPRINILNQETT